MNTQTYQPTDPDLLDPVLPYSHRNDVNAPPTIQGLYWRRGQHFSDLNLVLVTRIGLPYYDNRLMVFFTDGIATYELEYDSDTYWSGPVIIEPPKFK